MAVTEKGGGAGEPDALKRAADLLGRARLPVIGGLFTDIAGAEAALALAQKLGGVIDHAQGEGLARASRIMRETGGSPASFGEVRNRADTIVVIGDAPLKRSPELLIDLFPPHEGLPRPGTNARELILLGAGRIKAPSGVATSSVALGNKDLPALVAMLAAAVAERPFEGRGRAFDAKLVKAAKRLRVAAFAVFVYAAEELAEPVLHTILDIVRHLSVTTRAATLSLVAPGNGDGVNLCSAWTCGLPVRTSFAGPVPMHDPWLNDTRRLIDSGEADALLWIDALDTQGPMRPEGVPTVALASSAGGNGAELVIEVACAGRDHAAALYLPEIAGIGMVKASEPGQSQPRVADVRPRVADVLREIAKLVPARERCAC
jgi:formylmethanofuran dehydrogenase subunit B